ncbi:YeaH/YhbH family protein [Herbaspirillum sp. RTI4]|uniref:YeaH/YhbH family protein n=1 Tax=Herbaspirillum sp. RTI4 TaxID=3048640 RepID=UPI002AB5B115|nr:YeaH/YhbH family protein [Herbaspirillum sp. RTI4]MDY7576968.1 YeaH/YhbH family protein [Herbaspirillum sp. RTI4]MEA9982130.1 YeaH/YhbH family protein [Herbaspirillum sp. RTI4]
MLHQIIDRRLAGKNKSIANRERFLRRYRNDIRRSVTEAIRDRSITDIENGKSISIPKKGIAEPAFRHGPGGKREMVHPGNQEYLQGDRIERPSSGSSGGGGSAASNQGEGQDDFVFQLTREEFMQYFFEDLELPRLIQTSLMSTPSWKNTRAGYATEGSPNNIDIVRSLRSSLGRRIALGAPLRARLRELEALRETLLAGTHRNKKELQQLDEEIQLLKGRLLRIPFIDPFDLRYVNRVRQPQPSTQAVMFCIMDVSGSMDEARKDLAKRFFILLYLFLSRNYEHIEVVFIRHHTRADEVDEETFFRSQESGGTVVSSALELMQNIIETRYSPTEWNIYAAQASDGDNWNDDSPKCRQILEQSILPLVRYFSYIQVVEAEQNLWTEYAQLAASEPHFAMKKVRSASDIYPVFRELFEKQVVA